MLYAFLLPAVVLALLFVPVVVAIKKKKGEQSLKKAFAANICSFFAVMLICAALPFGMKAYADNEADAAAATAVTEEADTAEDSSSDTSGLLYIASALAVGLGAIGRAVTQRCHGFSMKIVAYDPYLDYDFCAENAVTPMTLDELLGCSDFIVLAMPLNDSTYHMINADAISKMKDGVIIANDARGGVVDAAAMVEGLRSGKVRFYATDVMEAEPPTADDPLLRLDNVIVSAQRQSMPAAICWQWRSTMRWTCSRAKNAGISLTNNALGGQS